MVGQTINQYQFLEKLGAGGMGEIYKAQDTRLNRFVAIKVLPANMSADPDRRRRFSRRVGSNGVGELMAKSFRRKLTLRKWIVMQR